MHKYWVIQVWDSANKLFEYRVRLGQMTENNMHELLKALAGKYLLDPEEFIHCYAKKGTRIYSDLLNVKRLTGNKYMLSCGTNPYAIAFVESEQSFNNSSNLTGAEHAPSS